MKKTISILLIVLLAVSILACSTPAQEQTAAPGAMTEQPKASAAEAQAAEPAEQTEALTPHKTVLVVVFSATGPTKGVAEKMAAIEDADL